MSKYKAQFETAGYRVLGAKLLGDNTRPKTPEVVYFNESDEEQAEKIAMVIKYDLSLKDMPIRLDQDDSALPGYIEVWFGK